MIHQALEEMRGLFSVHDLKAGRSPAPQKQFPRSFGATLQRVMK